MLPPPGIHSYISVSDFLTGSRFYFGLRIDIAKQVQRKQQSWSLKWANFRFENTDAHPAQMRMKSIPTMLHHAGKNGVTKSSGGRPRPAGWSRLEIRFDPARRRVCQRSPWRNNYWRWKRSPTILSEFDPKACILPCSRGILLWSGIFCRGFWQDDQCWNQNCDCLLLCLTFLTPYHLRFLLLANFTVHLAILISVIRHWNIRINSGKWTTYLYNYHANFTYFYNLNISR